MEIRKRLQGVCKGQKYKVFIKDGKQYHTRILGGFNDQVQHGSVCLFFFRLDVFDFNKGGVKVYTPVNHACAP